MGESKAGKQLPIPLSKIQVLYQKDSNITLGFDFRFEEWGPNQKNSLWRKLPFEEQVNYKKAVRDQAHSFYKEK